MSNDSIIEDLLKSIPDKNDHYSTTSHAFKKDLYEFIIENNIKIGAEFGCSRGYTTRLLSLCLDRVYAVDLHIDHNVKLNSDRDNIVFIKSNLYSAGELDIPDAIDLCLIDAVHEHGPVGQDIKRAISHHAKYIVFDDYGLFPGVKKAVDEHINRGVFKMVKRIGESAGFDFTGGRVLTDSEGVIVETN